MIDKPSPQNRDLVKTTQRQEGVFPKTRFIAVFDYEDGSQREFDGLAWKLTRPSRQAEQSNANPR